jgi:hypothetical protein
MNTLPIRTKNRAPAAFRLCMGALAVVFVHVRAAEAQLQVVANKEPQSVFSGDARNIAVMFRNPGDKAVEIEITTRLYQASSATAMRLSDAPWKKLQVLSGQTVIESAKLSFPEVKTETRFLVQWVTGTNTLLGKTEILVYPADLLKELKPLAGDEPPGIFDPQNQLKPLLKSVAIEFTDLEDVGLEDFSGKLAIVGPFASKTQMREGLDRQIESLAAKGVGVVWIQCPPERRDKLKPTFYTVTPDQGAVVVVQPDLVADLPGRPQAQLNLIHFARLARQPEPIRLPHLTPQP